MKLLEFRPKLFDCLKNYSKRTFASDLMAGIIVGIVALPLAIAFGIASGVSPEKGIVTAILAGLVVSLLGGSRVQIGGPTGAFIVIIYGIIQQYGEAGLIVATLMAGVLLVLMGVFRLGAVIKFIPSPVVVGFTSGIAVTIFTTQIADVFGLDFGGEKVPGDFVGKWLLYFRHFGTVDWWNAAVSVLSVLIIALVYGFDRRCISAVSGTFLGILVTCLLGSLFTDLFQIHGAVMSSSESLLYAGYQDLNLTRIFMASIFIGASGALMDLSVDITSAVHEVVEKRPDIGWKEAVRSGMNVGRSAMGTMTTTLLLAYSGGYIALLMVFMAQGTPLVNILNYKHVAAEMVHTVIGSFGLVTVAPFTALCAGVLLSQKKKDLEEGKKN